MRSANLLNDFAFKYVFGEDCKEAMAECGYISESDIATYYNASV
ncbi:hypothetical protein [uncultured Holdemanella sp.]|nr:hypothetical protein [uncultured Holdemanella sp.]